MNPTPLFSIHSQRLRVGMLLMLALYVTVSMRLNLSMGVTCMVNSTAFAPSTLLLSQSNNTSLNTEGNGKCVKTVDPNVLKDSGYAGTLLWSPSMQSLLFSGTFYGSLFTISISGYLADRFGPKYIIFAAVIDISLMTLAGPLLASESYLAYFISRIIMGVGDGFIFPCVNSVASMWFPATEKSTMAAFYTSGNQLASGITSWICASLCTSSLGWPSLFYIFGVIGLFWCVLWAIFTSNSPNDNRWIGEDEKEYLHRALATNANKTFFKENAFPWKHLIFGTAVQANYCSQFAYNFSVTIMQSFLPTYFKEVLFIPIHMNGVFTAVPFVTQIIVKNCFGALSDHLIKKKIISATTAVKMFQSVGQFGAAVALIALATIPSCENPYIAIPILMLYGISLSAVVCGCFTSILSIAPPYTGSMTSISRTYATAASLLGPSILSVIDLMGLPNKWLFVFCCAGLLNVVTGCFYFVYGSCDVLHWARPKLQEIERKI